MKMFVKETPSVKKETENYKRLIKTKNIILILMMNNFYHLFRDYIVLSTFRHILLYILLINVV